MTIKALLFECDAVISLSFNKCGNYFGDVVLEWLVFLSGIVVLCCSSIWRFLLLNNAVQCDEVCIAKN